MVLHILMDILPMDFTSHAYPSLNKFLQSPQLFLPVPCNSIGHNFVRGISIVILQRQRSGLLDQELIDGNVFAALLAHAALLDASEGGFGGRLVAGVLNWNAVSQNAWPMRQNEEKYLSHLPDRSSQPPNSRTSATDGQRFW